MCSCNYTFLLDIRARYLVNKVFCVSITTISADVKVNMLQDVSTVLLLHPTFSNFCLVEQESPLLHLPMLQRMLSLVVLSEIWASSVFSFALQSALCISCTFCFCHSGSHIDHLKTSHSCTEHAVLNASIFLLLDVEQVQGHVFVWVPMLALHSLSWASASFFQYYDHCKNILYRTIGSAPPIL
jgi:hypothetical protein